MAFERDHPNIVELHAMSDHDLNSLALPRSEIAGAVKLERHVNVGSAPSALQPNPNA